MELEQKKISLIHRYKFGEDKLNFAYQDKNGSRDSDVHYSQIPFKTAIFIEQNEWLRNVAYLWCGIGVLQIILALSNDSTLSSKGFWLFLGIICLAWYYLSKVKYTYFETNAGRLLIIQDKQHDKIIEEITKRRKQQLKDWYGQINPNNEVTEEISKFKWLLDNEVISEYEATKAIQQLELSLNSKIN